MPMDIKIILYCIVVLAGMVGFFVARHIRIKKKQTKPFVCPLNFDCHTVVNSDYSKFLGIPLELIGMTYYAIITLSYLVFLVYPALHVPMFANSVIAVSVVAFLYSGYLTYVQAAKLKEWCTYCLISAAMCTIIFCAVLGTLILG